MRLLVVLLMMSARVSLGAWEYMHDYEGRYIYYESEQSQTCWNCLRSNPNSNRPFSEIKIFKTNDKTMSVKIICGSQSKATKVLLGVHSFRDGRERRAFQYVEFSKHVVRIDVFATQFSSDIDWINRLLRSFDPDVYEIHSDWKFWPVRN